MSPIERNRWGVVVAYAALGAATQVLWLTFAPITTATAEHYGVSEGAVGWLAEIFPLLYVVLAVPAGMALDRWFVPMLRAGAALTAAGALLRLGGDSFGWALGGQLLVAIAQPLVLNAVTKLAGEYVAPAARPAAISLGLGGTFVGLLLGLLLGPALGSATDLRALLLTEAAVAVLAATALWMALRSRPAGAAAIERPIGLHELRTVWDDRFIRALCVLAFVGFGVFIALTTWLQGLLEPFGVSAGTAGAMLAAAVVAGVATTTWLPAAAARNGAERTVLAAALLACVVCCAVLAGARAPAAQFVFVAAIGAVVLPALPVLLELAERRAGSAGASAAALLWLAGNLGGIALAVPVGALVHHAALAFGLLALAAAAGLPFAWRLRSPGGALALGDAIVAAEARE
ncbi:MAG TPA: MFS transporter [Conexibacter sp.]|jgi:predicted MFS family arabinose efflux permease|nr:MFS transporter [Conexibacter sp.]